MSTHPFPGASPFAMCHLPTCTVPTHLAFPVHLPRLVNFPVFHLWLDDETAIVRDLTARRGVESSPRSEALVSTPDSLVVLWEPAALELPCVSTPTPFTAQCTRRSPKLTTTTPLPAFQCSQASSC
ncbi:hypothetical protein Hypma_012111 [Hypsizygus marmoreus]|uniref:Uncharacterized protein n=1 Tax=Hypsizygus marmoreus TaxID=39966 RepID=A0A369JJR5_HYPMA|nr:hypothetical protein Hypma_012111 [Hypsizygus marmoreus]